MEVPVHKICFVGASSTGKTSIVIRYTQDNFYEDEDDPTLEDSHRKEVAIDQVKCVLDILDTGGEAAKDLYEKWFKWADGVVLVYSVQSTYSFDLLPYYREEMIKRIGHKEHPTLLVATKVDIIDEGERMVTTKEGRSVAYNYRCPYVEVSSKTGQGVPEVFELIVREIRERQKAVALEQLSKPQKKKKNVKGTPVILDNPKTAVMQVRSEVKPFKSWKKTWIAIKAGVVYLYRSEQEFKEMIPTTALSLLTCTVKLSMNQKKGIKNCFEVISLQSRWYFQAETQPEMMEWIEAIQEGIALMLNENTAEKSKSRGGQAVSGNLQAWEILKQTPENNLCADCGAEQPDWISINLGILICIQCSGVHRSMGVHISKVRSITLDELENDVLDLMKAIGNKAANLIFEDVKALAVSGKKKPHAKDDRGTKEKFIRAKYEQKEFVSKPTETDPEALGRALCNATKDNAIVEMLRLIVAGANINHKEKESSLSPMEIAAMRGHSCAAQLLLLNGSEGTPRSMKGDQQQQTVTPVSKEKEALSPRLAKPPEVATKPDTKVPSGGAPQQANGAPTPEASKALPTKEAISPRTTEPRPSLAPKRPPPPRPPRAN